MPEISDFHTTTGSIRNPTYCAWRTFRDGKLEEASYTKDNSRVLQIYKNITRKTVRHASFFENIDNSDPDPPGKRESIRSLCMFERDLLRLTERKFKEKYPNVHLFDKRIKTRKVGERIIEETD